MRMCNKTAIDLDLNAASRVQFSLAHSNQLRRRVSTSVISVVTFQL